MQRLLTGLLGVSLLFAACGDDDADDDRAAVTSIPDETTTSSTTTTEPETVAVDVIPQDTALITEDYVEQVLNQLYEVSFESLMLTRKAGVVDEPAISRIEATSTADVVPRRLNDLSDLAAADFQGIADNPSPLKIAVLELLDVSNNCVVAEVQTDASGLMAAPPTSDPQVRDFVRIYTADEDQRRTGLNPTAWVIDQFPVTMDGSVPDLRCEP